VIMISTTTTTTTTFTTTTTTFTLATDNLIALRRIPMKTMGQIRKRLREMRATF